MPDEDFIDFHDIILAYLPLVDNKIPWKTGKVKWTVDRRCFFVHHEDIKHDGENAARVTRASTELFRSTYRNTTDQDMEYSIDQTRRTVTSVSATITKGVRFGGSFELELTPPAIPSLKLGLHSEVEFQKDQSETKEHEVTWTFQTRVSVPKQRAVRAILSVLEEHREGKFNVKTYFSGKILVDWEFKKKYGQVTLSDLSDLLVEDYKGRTRGYGFEKDVDGRIYFETKGICSCHYGLEQDVIIREVDLKDIEPEAEEKKRAVPDSRGMSKVST